MTLEEAIKHAEEKVKCGGKCGEDHAQLAEWLKELQKLCAVETEKRTEERTETHACDCISRQAAIYSFEFDDDGTPWNMSDIIYRLEQMPSAQPERTCVNCGRTANNGGWYADGGTRCPIEEHYALPKDGYCHLWEKRNVTDDDYPERRTDE